MSTKTFQSMPLYVQLRTDLTRRIAKGDWKRGDSMPNEMEIAREYGLSPGTVRKALDWMEDAHLIVRQQGRGTFVTGTSAETLEKRFNKVRLDTGEKVPFESRVLERSLEAATAEEASRLALAADEPVFKLRRMCQARGRPLMVEEMVVSPRVFPSLSGDVEHYDLAELSSLNGVLLGPGFETLTLASADAETATLLGLDRGANILLLERTIRTIEDQPAEWRRCWCNLEGYRYQVELH